MDRHEYLIPVEDRDSAIDRVLGTPPGQHLRLESFRFYPHFWMANRASARAKLAEFEMMCRAWLDDIPCSVSADSDTLDLMVGDLTCEEQESVLRGWVFRGGRLWKMSLLAEYLETVDRRTRGHRNSPGFVYLMERPGGLLKIGHAINPGKRRPQVQADEGGAVIRLVAAGRFEDRFSVEQELHREYAHRRVRGEWFALDPDEVAAVVAFLGGAVS